MISIDFEEIFYEATEKNPDGQSIAYQPEAKEPMVRKYGCFLMSLIRGAGKSPRIADKVYKACKGKYFNDNCLIQDAPGLLNKLTGDSWTGGKSNAFDPNADINIAHFSNNTEDGHFVLMKGPNPKDIKMDSMGHSKAAAGGHIESWRNYYRNGGKKSA